MARATPSNEQRSKLIRLIHVAKRECKISDDVYRALIAGAANGKESSKDCTVRQLEAVIAAFKDRYKWRPTTKNRRAQAETREQAKIRALWSSLAAFGALKNPSDNGLAAFLKRVTGGKVYGLDALRFVQGDNAFKVIEALKKMLEREGVSWSPDDLIEELALIIGADRAAVMTALWRRVANSSPERGAFGLWVCHVTGKKLKPGREFPQITEVEADSAIKALGRHLADCSQNTKEGVTQ